MFFKFATIEVKDINESLKFYTEVLNLSQLRRFSPQEGIEIVFLKDEEDNQIELIENKMTKSSLDEKTQSKVQLGYEVGNLDKKIDYLHSKNIEIKRGPIEIPFGRFITIEDPDGIRIGLFEEN